MMRTHPTRGHGGRLREAVAARLAEVRRRFGARPDEGAETAEIVVGIALATGAALMIWKFLGPALLDIAANALGSL